MARNKKKKSKKSMIIFVIELIILLALVCGIFVYAKINEGLRNIGSATGNGEAGTGTAVAETTTSVASDGTVVEIPVESDPEEPAKDLVADADADAAAENEGVSQNKTLKGYTNIALVGIDTRDTDQIDYANSDTMIIASINNATGQVRMVSIYRDTLLNIGTRESSTSQGDDGGEEEYESLEEYDEGGEDSYYDDGGDSSYVDDGGEDSYVDDGGDDSYVDDGGEESYISYVDEGGEDSYVDDGGDSSYTDDGGEESYYDEGGESSYVDDGGEESYISYTDEGETYSDSDTSSHSDSDTEIDEDEEEYTYSKSEYYDYQEEGTSTSDGGYQTAVTTAGGRYDKANAAYCNGSAKQLLSMLNRNFDLNIHDYVVVDFSAVAILVDDIGGIDVWMTKQEVVHMNNYCKETSKVTGMSYDYIEPEEMPREYHLNGVQAVSYARIRYTAGNDMKRTQRQRVVIQKIVNKAKAKGMDTINAMINDVFPLVKTSFSSAEIVKMATRAFDYEIEKTTGFPFEHIEKNVYVGSKKLDAVVPVTLEQNVKEMHEFLFDEKDYECSSTVKEFSNDIIALSGLSEKSRDVAIKNSVIGKSGGEADVVK